MGGRQAVGVQSAFVDCTVVNGSGDEGTDAVVKERIEGGRCPVCVGGRSVKTGEGREMKRAAAIAAAEEEEEVEESESESTW